jgi:O-antigen/teichoic acid export membrane protein
MILKKFLFKSTGSKQIVLKNTIWIFCGDVLGRLIRMGLVIYAARNLGLEGWGTFSYATSIGIILMTFSDIGLYGLITREIVQKKENYRTFVSTALVLKVILLSASVLLIILFGPIISHVPGTKRLLLVIAATSLFDALNELGFCINRASERMERETIVKTITNVVILVSGIILLKINLAPISLALAYALGSASGFIAIAIIVRKQVTELWVKIDKNLFRTIFHMTWPFALITLIVIALGNIDVYMIGIWKNAKEVGLYSSVQRIYSFAAVIPSTITAVTFPLMSRIALDEIKFRAVLEKTISFLLFLGAPIAIGGILLSKELVVLVFGQDYALSVPVMKVLMVLILPSFPFTFLSSAIFARNKQKELASVYFWGIAINIICNLLLIPTMGALGAAIATFFSTTVMTVVVWLKLKKINYFEVMPALAKIFFPLLIMSCTVLILKYLQVYVVANVLISGLVYFLALIYFKIPIIKDIKEMIVSQTSS